MALSGPVPSGNLVNSPSAAGSSISSRRETPCPFGSICFGDEIEALRSFDPVSQKSLEKVESLVLQPANEVFLDADSIARFRSGYREAFGSVSDDPLYVAVTEGRRQIGMEHWLPLFHETLETLFDYLPMASVSLDNDTDQVRDSRLEMIADYYDARVTFEQNRSKSDTSGQPPYRPLPTKRLYLPASEVEDSLADRLVVQFSPFASPEGIAASVFDEVISVGARRVPDFAAVRAQAAAAMKKDDIPPDNVFVNVRSRLFREIEEGRRAVVAAFSAGSRERLGQLLADASVIGLVTVENWDQVRALPLEEIALAILPVEHGFTSEDLFLVTEQDILGERIVRTEKKRRRAEDFIADVSEIATGDLVVHVDHGIGRYDGLETLRCRRRAA